VLRSVVPLEQRREIATAVNDTNDCDVRTPIEDQVVADRKRTDAGTKVVASAIHGGFRPMFDDDPRWGSDPRERDDDARDRDRVDPRDAFVEKLDLPRGLERESRPRT